jgi:hypothetical protein
LAENCSKFTTAYLLFSYIDYVDNCLIQMFEKN